MGAVIILSGPIGVGKRPSRERWSRAGPVRSPLSKLGLTMSVVHGPAWLCGSPGLPVSVKPTPKPSVKAPVTPPVKVTVSSVA